MTHGHGHGHGHGHADGPLTPVEEHLAEILATVAPLAPTELSLGDVGGLVLAEDVSTAGSLPSFDNSGMDGYAVRVVDVAAATEENPGWNSSRVATQPAVLVVRSTRSRRSRRSFSK